ncbi:MAG: bifunctional UDP-N-acetylglucosamine diphosphorylase/glucosamine-1-phosphate N-acetyltransferase GlmU [Bdellovibrionaceae bacterium]|nr:bifunctional UDP-N-acetylglucosamine diphosphorylase/glucosamine-1-phosphate N-acetyltransferase GlmU [Pseudobdellovibrionaceae bacterium]
MTEKDENKNKEVPFTAIILAAGKGTRMNSALPKVLHPVAGKPMISRVIASCKKSGISDIRVVVGHGSSLVKTVLEPEGVTFYEQKQQLGTADAVRSAQPETIDGNIIILNGDHPMIESHDIEGFIRDFKEQKLDIGLVTTILKEPGDFGRVVRNGGELYAIVEAKDASAEAKKIKEVNTGIYLTRAAILNLLLPEVKNENQKKEYYLTDIISLGIEERKKVKTIPGAKNVSMGVNNQVELAKATKLVFKGHMKKLLENGVMIIDPKNTYIEETVEVGPGTIIYPGSYLKGKTTIGKFCMIETNTFIVDTTIEDSVQIRSGSYLESSIIRAKCSIGPYARIRPDSELAEDVHIGNFVEVKKSKLGKHTKAAHLAYIGDAEIGESTNIGCGTIFVNYMPNKSKHKTKVGDNCFIGSDVQLIAPIEIGSGATLGAGSVITKSVPANALAVTRATQIVKENYKPKP